MAKRDRERNGGNCLVIRETQIPAQGRLVVLTAGEKGHELSEVAQK